MKLLIVDDSAMVRRLIEKAYLGSVFTEIQTASDGLLAVTMYKQFNPDVVTLDITMPHMDGLAALGEILGYNPRAKVLVISALADHHTAIESLKRGASQFICKPFTAADLRSSLDEVMNPQVASRSRSRKKRRGAGSPSGQTEAQALPTPETGAVPPAPAYPTSSIPQMAPPMPSPEEVPQEQPQAHEEKEAPLPVRAPLPMLPPRSRPS